MYQKKKREKERMNKYNVKNKCNVLNIKALSKRFLKKQYDYFYYFSQRVVRLVLFDKVNDV